MKFKKEDLEDLFYDLIEKASEHYDNALDGISFENDNVDLLFPLKFLIYNFLPDDFELDIPDKVVDWYKNKPWGVCLSDVLNKEGLWDALNKERLKMANQFIKETITAEQITPENLRSKLSKLREDLDLDESIATLAFLLDGVWEALLKRKKQIKEGSKDDKEGLKTANHDRCGDNRFKVIEKAKEALLESTNIESSPEEMAVLDSFLFRCWQMGWLAKIESSLNLED